jgi:hypothetical protein
LQKVQELLPAIEGDAMSAPAAEKARPAGALEGVLSDGEVQAAIKVATHVARTVVDNGGGNEDALAEAIRVARDLLSTLIKSRIEYARHVADCQRRGVRPAVLGEYNRPRPRHAVPVPRQATSPTAKARRRSREQRRRATRARALGSSPDDSDPAPLQRRPCEGAGCDVVFETRNPRQKYHDDACGVRTRTARSRARIPSAHARDIAAAAVHSGELAPHDAILILTARSAASARAALARVGREAWRQILERAT